MMEKFLEQSPPGIRRWWYRHEIAAHEEAVAGAHHVFEESKVWSMQKLIESQEAQQAYKDFMASHGLDGEDG